MRSEATYEAALERLAAEQDAVRRIARLASEAARPTELFVAVVSEIVQLLGAQGGWLVRYEPHRSISILASENDSWFPVGTRWPLDGPSVCATVLDSGAPARFDDYLGLDGTISARTRDSGFRSVSGVPITVDGALWGMLAVGTTGQEPLPTAIDARLRELTELIASAISTAVSGDRLRGLADRQAALHRVATLVAEGLQLPELFAAVSREIARLLDVPAVALFRYEPDRTTTIVASLNAPGLAIGSRRPVDGSSLSAQVLETGRAARVDGSAELAGTLGDGVRDPGLGSAIGLPIVVEGRVWGMGCIGTAPGVEMPPAIEDGLRDFIELVGIAISNTQSRERPRRLAAQQAALRRVAMLVAEGAAPAELFSAVADEAARILDVASVTVSRFEADASVVVASHDDPGFPVGSRWPLDAPGLNAIVVETGRPARIDDFSALEGPVAAAARATGMDSGIGVPIVVDGSVWGMIAAGRRRLSGPLPDFAGLYSSREVLATEPAHETEARLAAFTELVATAISKAQAHDSLRQLAEEQAALRRVATLVAEGAPPPDIFAAVVDEVDSILGLEGIEMARYEADGTATVIGAAGDHPFPPGSAWKLDGPSIMADVFRTRLPSRMEHYAELPGTIAEIAHGAGFRSAIGAPIIVDGLTWGAIIAFSRLPERIPEVAVARLTQFTELVATAVSNATARAELVASRARIVAAADDARRRLERNLHDGTQQRLIALRLDLQRVRATIPGDPSAAQADLEVAERDLSSALEEVREVSRGLHPAQLTRGGLALALSTLGRRSPIPVATDVELGRRPPRPVETGVYYVVSEALANAIKHSRAAVIAVTVRAEGDSVRAVVSDDGVGGALASAGSGLTGLRDRVVALGGRFTLDSPRERGTTISIELPVAP